MTYPKKYVDCNHYYSDVTLFFTVMSVYFVPIVQAQSGNDTFAPRTSENVYCGIGRWIVEGKHEEPEEQK